MTIKELKELIANLPNDAEVRIDYKYWEGDCCGRWSEEESKIRSTEFYDWSAINTVSEFHLKGY